MRVLKCRKRPIVVEAIYYDGENRNDVRKFCGKDFLGWQVSRKSKRYVVINTLEGVYKVPPGFYIIKGIKGEVYPCRKDIFEETYDIIEASEC